MSDNFSTEKIKPALQLCADGFLSNFSGSFLEELSLEQWKRELGHKDNLYLVPTEHYACIMVDADLSYSKNHIIAWSEKIGSGGLLALEACHYTDPETIQNMCPDVLEYIQNSNPKVWLFGKKNTDRASAMLGDVVKASVAQKSKADLLEKLGAVEQFGPHFCGWSVLLLERLKAYRELELPQLVLDECQRVEDANPAANIKMMVALSRITYGEDFYQKGFLERKRLVDRLGPQFRTDTPPDEKLNCKRWNGEEVKGKTLVIWTEFGLGDEIMFAQLAYYFKFKQADKVILIAQPAVADLLATSLDIDQIIVSNEIEQQLPSFDYWVYPHDILAYTASPFSRIPKRHPYLFVQTDQVAQYQSLFADSGKLKVGLVWRGNPEHENDAFRSIHDLKHIESLFEISSIDWYCFQKDCNEAERRLLEKYNVPHITKNFQSCMQTAAAMKNLDYLISVDTSTIHIAGAIGIPALLLLPYLPDWRWGLIEKDNLWYPNIRSLRCKMPLPEWDAVIDELKQTVSSFKKL